MEQVFEFNSFLATECMTKINLELPLTSDTYCKSTSSFMFQRYCNYKKCKKVK